MRAHRLARAPVQRELLELGEVQDLGAQAVVEIVRVIRDLVADVGELPLEARSRLEVGQWHRMRVAREVGAVLQDPRPRLVAEVQPGVLLGAVFEPVHDAQALAVVLEAPVRLQELVQHVLARVAERWMAEVVGQDDRLDQVLVRAQGARGGSRDLSDLERVGQPVPEVIPFRVGEDLGLVLQAPERARVQDAVAVALEGGAIGVRGLGLDAATRVAREQGVGGE